MDQNWIKKLPIDQITDISSIQGGDVNDAYQVVTANKRYFLLVQPDHPKSFYESEIAGLNAFKEAGISAPSVIATGDINGDAFLLLNFLEKGSGSQRELGQLVAKLHKTPSPNGQFGFDYPYSGTSITFDNSYTDSWIDLFVNRRLDKLAQVILEKGLWTEQDHTLYKKAREIIVATLEKHDSKPELIHGDLWGGNYMFLSDGSAALIDPAALYGDRELDIGVTTVFGGFSSDFYETYQETYPLALGYQQRLQFYRLYYLMVHLNKFGTLYTNGVQNALETVINDQ